MTTCLVLGGAGFIGSAFCRKFVQYHATRRLIVVDKARPWQFQLNLGDLGKEIPGYDTETHYVPATTIDSKRVKEIIEAEKPCWVVNFAADSHVDRSIDSPRSFWENNVMQMEEMLRMCVDRPFIEKFLHISTDEVYGDRWGIAAAHEDSGINPGSPYAASKVAQEAMVMAYGRTYRLPYIITRSANNYGPRQAPEKLIPLMISKIMAGEKLPIYGDGLQTRDWIHVDDHVDYLLGLLSYAKDKIYNIGNGELRTNLSVVNHLWRAAGSSATTAPIETVEDRPGHDRQYHLDMTKTFSELHKPSIKFEDGIASTVQWYRENQDWVEAMMELGYTNKRVGLGT